LRQTGLQMAIVGYARCSTEEQDLTIQLEALKTAGCEEIFAEKVSGTSTVGREKLAEARRFLRKGDTLVVTRIDRLARSMLDLQLIVKELRDKGVHLKATEQPINTGDATGKAFLDMLGVFAEFETNLRRERQMEGIAKAKAEGKYKGRKPTARVKADEVHRLKAEGMGPAAIAKRLGIGRASVYRALQVQA
jgi:DNA invertase Pin-like site-specific DNA recombinase